MKILGFYITRQAPMSLTLNNARVEVGTPKLNDKGELEIEMTAQGSNGNPLEYFPRTEDGKHVWIVPRKKAGSVFELLRGLYFQGASDKRKGKKGKVNDTVYAVHRKIKDAYRVEAAKK